jgi:hypothetical protein
VPTCHRSGNRKIHRFSCGYQRDERRRKTAGICSWKGGKPDAYASVTLFPGNGRDVPAGQERPAFDASIELMKRQHKPGELEPISGIGERMGA